MATQREIAQHLDITEQWVRKLLKSGKMPASEGRGGYDLDACRLSYIRYLRGINSGQIHETDGEAEDDNQFQNKLEFEKWREKKRENDIAESLVAPVELLTSVLRQAATQIHPILDGITPSMKRSNPELTGPDIQIAEEHIARAKNVIAELKIDVGAL